MKTCIVDIECGALEAIGAGVLLCVVVKEPERRPMRFRADDFRDRLGHEIRLLNAVWDCLNEYDLWIGHNVRYFDYPWLVSRLIQFQMQSLQSNPYLFDTKEAFRKLLYRTRDNGFGRPQCGLEAALDFFRIPIQKTRILPSYQWDAIWGDPQTRRAAMNDVVDHCVRDVQGTEELAQRLISTAPVSIRPARGR